MGSVLTWRLPTMSAHDLAALALLGVLWLAVVMLGTYALVARCLRDTQPAERPEILWALAGVLGSLRGGRCRRPTQPAHQRSPRLRRRRRSAPDH
jgi:hypothetical protein